MRKLNLCHCKRPTAVELLDCLALRARNDRAGFTLTEVLITLGIIGVVAALTMPALIQKHKRQEVSVRLKKFNSTMSQALIFAEAEYGDAREWDRSGTAEETFNTYFKPYLRMDKSVGG
ncbi:MAG: prepilin-type N-terminal cleavage/methylation domain-containing protein, partial [Heliobacteriaceae bacterium]|nr:prepilin-type N-terminal cleavage/methylation domain-containing protein [Heliobacteriaceae bacterium]